LLLTNKDGFVSELHVAGNDHDKNINRTTTYIPTGPITEARKHFDSAIKTQS